MTRSPPTKSAGPSASPRSPKPANTSMPSASACFSRSRTSRYRRSIGPSRAAALTTISSSTSISRQIWRWKDELPRRRWRDLREIFPHPRHVNFARIVAVFSGHARHRRQPDRSRPLLCRRPHPRRRAGDLGGPGESTARSRRLNSATSATWKQRQATSVSSAPCSTCSACWWSVHFGNERETGAWESSRFELTCRAFPEADGCGCEIDARRCSRETCREVSGSGAPRRPSGTIVAAVRLVEGRNCGRHQRRAKPPSETSERQKARMKIILASASPRRAEILRNAGDSV